MEINKLHVLEIGYAVYFFFTLHVGLGLNILESNRPPVRTFSGNLSLCQNYMFGNTDFLAVC